MLMMLAVRITLTQSNSTRLNKIMDSTKATVLQRSRHFPMIEAVQLIEYGGAFNAKKIFDRQ